MKYRFYSTAIKTFARLPLRAMYLLSDVAALTLHRLVGYRVEVVRKNLAMAFPEKSDKERRQIEKQFYRHLCDIFIETAKLAHISDAEAARRVRVSGMEHINDAVDAGQSVVLLLGHFGNWEWVTAMAPEISSRALSSEIYHPLRDKAFDRLMLDLRTRFGTENIPMNNAVRRLLEVHRSGRPFVCGFISDQRPFSRELKNWTDFLGIDTAYVNGGEVIGSKIGARFLYVDMEPRRRGYYDLTIKPLKAIEDGEPNPYTRAYLRELEQSIRRTPWAWLWSHNRWKRRRDIQAQ
ncbi:MAG: lipd A biosynthesis protein [Muribaculaceae bacterium]|nr:lipd A biosynthesis protein [Muribaculaceae bacterium]